MKQTKHHSNPNQSKAECAWCTDSLKYHSNRKQMYLPSPLQEL